MPVPTHRPGCDTAIYPTQCPHCGDDVYFFSCTCGSRVFFDLPHPPWNPHEERCYLYLISYLSETENTPIQHIRSLVEQYALEKDIPIPDDVEEHLTELERKHGHRKPEIKTVEPGGEERPIVGIVMTYNAPVNFLKRFDFEDNRLGRGLLGRLLDESYVEIKLREDNLNADVLREFKVFMPLRLAKEHSITQHSKVFAILEPEEIAGRDPVWTTYKVELITARAR